MGTANAEDAVKPAVGNIDTSKQGSLTIHKYDGTAGTNGKGNKLDESDPALKGHNKLDGAGFTVYPILHKQGDAALNLKEQAEWKVLASLSKTFVDKKDVEQKLEEKGLKLGTAKSEVFTVNGEITLNKLDLSAYAVFETTKPAKATSAVAPFIVTIPFPNATSGINGWLYDVHVYPKNQITDTPTKKVAENTPTVNVGTELLWTVTGKVPTPTKAGEKLQAFRFNDTLDPNLKCGKTEPVILVSGQKIASSKYTYSCKDANPSKIVIEFTSEYLATLNGGESIQITFSSTVAKIPGDKVIPNKTYNFEFKNNGDNDFNVVPPSPETPVPNAYFGDFNISKVSDDKKTTLKDAEFKVYTKLTSTGAVDETSVVKGSDSKDLVYKSNEDGLVQIAGLYRGDRDDAVKAYYVVETKAPAGFKDPDGTDASGPTKEKPLKIEITKDSGKNTAPDKTVINNPFTDGDVPNLPLTGAQGKVLLTLAGLAVLAIAAGTAFKTRSRKN